MNSTLLGEWLLVDVTKKTSYTEPKESQRGLAKCLEYYNLNRSHHGHWMNGSGPTRTRREPLGLDDLPPLILVQQGSTDQEDEEPSAAA